MNLRVNLVSHLTKGIMGIYCREMRVYDGLGKVTKELSRSCGEFNGNKNTLVVTYDGGMLYDVMNGDCDFGWSLHDKLMGELDKVLGEYGLYVEPINSWSFTLWSDGNETPVKKHISLWFRRLFLRG